MLVSSFIKDFALRGLADQLFESGPNQFGSIRDDFTLGRSRQRNSQTCLQPLQSIHGTPLPYFNSAIIAAALSSYFFSPPSCGASAS